MLMITIHSVGAIQHGERYLFKQTPVRQASFKVLSHMQ